MPETYANPYSGDTPLGQALKGLSGAIMSGPSEGKRLAEAEIALQRKQTRENTAALGDVFRKYGTPDFDRGMALATGIRAGVDANNLGGYERYGAANTYGAADQRTTNAFVGAGGAFTGTAQGARESEAAATRRTQMGINEQRYQFDNKPFTVGTDTGPVIVRQNEAYGRPAVEDLSKVKGNAARVAMNSPGGLAAADETTQQFIGASSKTDGAPKNYVKDGVNYITTDGITDSRTGQPLPQGGYLANAQGPANDVGLSTSVKTDLQKQNIGNQQFRGLLGFTRNVAKQDPNNFGATGFVKGVLQDGVVLAGNVSQGLGYNGIQDAVNDVRRKAAANGVNPSLLSGAFDPKLPALQTAADLLVFSAAEALAGQSGRGVSDKDVKIIKQVVGDPREWMTSQEKYLSKMDTLEQILNIRQEVVDQNLRGAPGSSMPPAQAAPGVNAPPASAPGAPQPQAAPVAESWERGPDGVLRRVR